MSRYPPSRPHRVVCAVPPCCRPRRLVHLMSLWCIKNCIGTLESHPNSAGGERRFLMPDSRSLVCVGRAANCTCVPPPAGGITWETAAARFQVCRDEHSASLIRMHACMHVRRRMAVPPHCQPKCPCDWFFEVPLFAMLIVWICNVGHATGCLSGQLVPFSTRTIARRRIIERSSSSLVVIDKCSRQLSLSMGFGGW